MNRYIDLELALNELLRLYEEDCDRYGVEIPECFDYGRAREALIDLPTIEVSEDCISREFALQVISDYVNYPTEGDKVCAIKNAPSAVPSRAEGEWKPYGKGYICSECERVIVLESRDNYCPGCGARMKGADE